VSSLPEYIFLERRRLQDCSTLLRITGLQSDGSSQTRRSHDFPKKLNFSTIVSRYNDILLMPPPAVPLSQQVSEHATGSLEHRLSELDTQRRPSTRSTGLTKRIASKNDNAEIQSSIVTSMSRHLQGMMHPEQITQGDTQAYGTLQQSAYEDSPTVTPTTTHASTRRMGRFSTIASNDTFPLLAETQQNISARKPYHKKAAKALAEKAGGSNDTGQMVLCQCGFGKEEGDMVRAPLFGITWVSYSDILTGTMLLLLNLAALALLRLHLRRRPTLARRTRLLLVLAR
jgi:hypothetical protein